MLPEHYRWIEEQFEPEGDPWLLAQIASELEQAGNREGAALVYDRAFGIDPTLEPIRQARARLLDELAVVEHGIRFRYIPAGPFLMGSRDGEPDEQPLHPVWLGAFWLSETPISWETYCRLLDWEAPPDGLPRNMDQSDDQWIYLYHMNRIRLQYCEDQTTTATDWHAHDPRMQGQVAFGIPRRSDPEAPWRYSTKPMVAVAWQEAQNLASRLSTSTVRYMLPSEAQWEKAARGGRIGSRYPWGDEPPSHDNCDFARFREFSIRPMKTFAANGYGLYAMSGGVWEWTRDWYDREAYRHAGDRDPEGPDKGEEKVLRGGSWADCACVVTVTFRMSRPVTPSRYNPVGVIATPTIGFRLSRMVTAPPSATAASSPRPTRS